MTSGPDGWLAALPRAAAGVTAEAALGTVARHLGRACGSPALEQAVDARWPEGPELPAAALPPPGAEVPDALGWAYEALADPTQRRRGLHYTPSAVADRLVAVGLAARTRAEGEGLGPVVCDPACGGGAFLLAAARALAAAGLAPRVVLTELLVGLDVDAVAVAVAATALELWAGKGEAEARVVTADALAGGPWPHQPIGGFDLVVGNPPFQSQLGAATARSGDEADRLRAVLGAGVTGYVDTAALFLLAAVEQVRPGGSIVLIQPQSVLAGRDAAGVRTAVGSAAPLVGLWVCDEPVFAARTRVCAPVLRRPDADPPPDPDPDGDPAPDAAAGRARHGEVRRWQGRGVVEAPAAPAPDGDRWAPLAADLRGIPPVALRAGPLDELAAATAGFRDQYYGLVAHVREATGAPAERPLVTCGLIDPASCAWGAAAARYAKRRWQAPVVDLDALAADDPALAAWVTDRLVPKVLVATQTRVLEAVADVEGRLVPSTPVISVPTTPERLWLVLAALLAPPLSAWALHRSAGTALAPDALKVSAAHLREAPAPVDAGAWRDGAIAAREAQEAPTAATRRSALLALGEAMTAAHAIHGAPAHELRRWWESRLPSVDRRRRPGSRPMRGSTRSDKWGAGR